MFVKFFSNSLTSNGGISLYCTRIGYPRFFHQYQLKGPIYFLVANIPIVCCFSSPICPFSMRIWLMFPSLHSISQSYRGERRSHTARSKLRCYWGIDLIRKHPQVITIMGGVYTIPSHGRFMAARVFRIFPHSWRTSTTLRRCQESETMQGDRRVLEPKPRRGCAVGAVLLVSLGSAGHLSNN